MNLAQQMDAITETSDMYKAVFIQCRDLAKIKAITGTLQRRIFHFDRPVSPEQLLDFYASPERKALDTLKHLRNAMLTG
jgi:hypothetical protein